MESLLEIKSLSAGYGTDIVLDNITMSVGDNDFIGVIGPNGGGKTTLLRVILGLIKPVSGEILFRGDDKKNFQIGYLPQISEGDNTFPVTVKDVILSGLMINKGLSGRMNKNDKAEAERVMDELGLNGMGSRSLKELSGGQLQRVFLGRAVIGSPSLLLLDEPGNFVDFSFEHDFYDKLKELNKRMAILMVSHDVGTISSHVKSFACINRYLHYHPSAFITNEQLKSYGCPIQLIAHGDIPHTILEKHK